MRLNKVSLHEFSTYRQLDFTFSNRGLALISGANGSGKSTLCDAIPWVLFGRTAKNGAVDDVKAWGVAAPCTTGTLELEHGGKTYEITRIRSKGNDLFLTVDGGEPIRGKDLADTQAFINSTFDISLDSYLAGHYFHEFSQTAQFFVANAKTRRTVIEQLADLSLAKTLQKNIADYSKDVKKDQSAILQSLLLKKSNLDNLNQSLFSFKRKLDDWERKKVKMLEEVELKIKNYDQEKQENLNKLSRKKKEFMMDLNSKIQQLECDIKDTESEIVQNDVFDNKIKAIDDAVESLSKQVCPTCGTEKDSQKRLLLVKEKYKIESDRNKNNQLKTGLIQLNLTLERLKKQTNPYDEQIFNEKTKRNTYSDQKEFILFEVNPYTEAIEEMNGKVVEAVSNIVDLERSLEQLNEEQSDLDTLTSIVSTFRASVLHNTVLQIESETNRLLDTYFDSEIQVSLTLEDSDKLEITVRKGENNCSYTQLSKGQRQILKICFAASVMKSVNNFSGANFNCLFFDESLDGLDESMKDKAFSLFEELSLNYESVFVVEHSSSFKNRFTKKFNVELLENGSVIDEES